MIVSETTEKPTIVKQNVEWFKNLGAVGKIAAVLSVITVPVIPTGLVTLYMSHYGIASTADVQAVRAELTASQKKSDSLYQVIIEKLDGLETKVDANLYRTKQQTGVIAQINPLVSDELKRQMPELIDDSEFNSDKLLRQMFFAPVSGKKVTP